MRCLWFASRLQRIERRSHLARVLIAIGGPPGQATIHDGAQPGRNACRERRQGFAHDRFADREGGRSAERHAPGEHLVEHHAERPHVAPGVGGCAAQKFRREVVWRPHDRAGQRQLFPRGRVSGLGDRRLLGEPEVEDLDVPPAGDHHVAALDVAMNDALGMRGFQRIGDLNTDGEYR